jgi:imidazoleglycerol phosphate synthase glutamine amidotransferase subunit HisH
MQLLFDESEEMGQHEGLHIIPGKVRRFPDQMADPAHPGRALRIPQIGWNQLHIHTKMRCLPACLTAPMPTLPTATIAMQRKRVPY